MDALYTKARENHRVRNKDLMIAIGINTYGHREIIGFAVDDTESGESWNNFFISLKERGLSNIDIMINDSHMGLDFYFQAGSYTYRVILVSSLIFPYLFFSSKYIQSLYAFYI